MGRALVTLLTVVVAAVGCGTLFPYAPADGGDGDVDTDVDADGDGDTDADGDVDLICRDECLYNFDGICDDGGRGASSNWCTFGLDCTDCGARDPGCVPYCGDPGEPWQCGWDECGGSCGVCPLGQFCYIAARECTECSCDGAECGFTGCGDSCGICPEGNVCSEWECSECTCADPALECGYDEDRCVCGVCDSGYCSNISHTCDPGATALCNDSCFYAGDGICDDHGVDCAFAACPFGADCTDCGPRTEADRLPADVPCSR